MSLTYKKIKRLQLLKLIKKTKVIRTLDGMDESFYTLKYTLLTRIYFQKIFNKKPSMIT
jgi:hypothetical protein